MQPVQSPQGTLNRADLKNLLITAVLFGLSAVITSLTTNLNLLHLSSTGTLIVTLALGMAAKFIQKLLDGPKM